MKVCMVTKPVAKSNSVEIDVAEEDVGRDEDELEDNAVKLDTIVKVSSGRWVTSVGTLEGPDRHVSSQSRKRRVN